MNIRASYGFYKCFDMFTSSVSITLSRQIWSVTSKVVSAIQGFWSFHLVMCLPKIRLTNEALQVVLLVRLLVSENLLFFTCFTCSLEGQYLDRMVIGQT